MIPRRLPVPVVIGPLGAPLIREVSALADRIATADGVAPFSEQALIRLGRDEPWLTHVVVRDGTGRPVGYAQVDRAGAVATAELAVDPKHRKAGVGALLLRICERDATRPQCGGPTGDIGLPLRVWAHGQLPDAVRFASRHGYQVVRELLLLARPLAAPTGPQPLVQRGFALRPFRPGADDVAWVALNSRAFAAHGEQGRLSLADLRERLRQAWFDPMGLLVIDAAGNPGALAGYVWTKVHNRPAILGEVRAPDLREGEIYALGVDPTARDRGLGTALLAAALRQLTDDGCEEAWLYVDASNLAALSRYRAAGFTQIGIDVQFGLENPSH